jgi:hypothetical protein
VSKQQAQIGTFIRVAGAVGPFRPTINPQAIDCGGVIHQDRDLITILVPSKSLFSPLFPSPTRKGYRNADCRIRTGFDVNRRHCYTTRDRELS